MLVSPLYRNSRPEHYFTLFGLLGVLALDIALESSDRRRRWLWLAAMSAALAVAFLWSEVAICFIGVAALWAATAPRGVPAAGRRSSVVQTLALLSVLMVVLLVWYWQIGAPLQRCSARWAATFRDALGG